MKIRKPNNESAEKRGLASGCLGVVFDVGVWVVSTVFITLGAALFIFGVFTFEPEITAGTVFLLVAAPIAIIVFIRVGREILRDLRNQK